MDTATYIQAAVADPGGQHSPVSSKYDPWLLCILPLPLIPTALVFKSSHLSTVSTQSTLYSITSRIRYTHKHVRLGSQTIWQ